MLESIKTFFNQTMALPAGEDPQVRRHDIRLAACALLLELAYADEEFGPDEHEHLESAIRRQYRLDKAQADKLLRLAERARAEAVDLWQFTRLIKQNYSLGQKMVLIEVMWGLVYADGELKPHEQRLMRKLCSLLDIEPGYLADVRRRVEADLPEGCAEGGAEPDEDLDEAESN